MHSAKRVNIVSVKLVKESSMLYKQRRVRSPQDSYELFRDYLGSVDREHFVVMCLDTKNQPTNISTVHLGSLNASLVHPAILSTAASIICCHPHTLGDPTARLVEVAKIIGIELIDHIILGDDNYISLKERGYFLYEETLSISSSI